MTHPDFVLRYLLVLKHFKICISHKWRFNFSLNIFDSNKFTFFMQLNPLFTINLKAMFNMTLKKKLVKMTTKLGFFHDVMDDHPCNG